MSLFVCPVCGLGLTEADGRRRYLCGRGHSFDRAAAGYVHLLPANRMHSRDPGDDKGMAAARNRFLSGDWYAPLRDRLADLASLLLCAGGNFQHASLCLCADWFRNESRYSFLG